MPVLTLLGVNGSRNIAVKKGTLLLDVLRQQSVEVYAPCGGKGTCGKCLIMVPDHGSVTSCRYPITRDLSAIIPEPAEMAILSAQFEHSVSVPFSPGPLASLSTEPVGVAIDLGTTTMVLHFMELTRGGLLETRSIKNPQTLYGADVISRIHFSISQTNGLELLQKALIRGINEQLSAFITDHQLKFDNLVKISVSGNTTMLHLLLGKNPGSLAYAPFLPVFTDSQSVNLERAGLTAHPQGEMETLPALSAYIGADIVGGIGTLAQGPDVSRYLYIDIGTNGELALITPDKIYCCATAAGPAFEGANIEHGMAAIPGAVSRYNNPGSYQTIGNSAPAGFCGSGLIDAIAWLIRNGQIQSDGFMPEMEILIPPENTANSSAITLSPQDVREIQLSKSAIASGISLLMRKAACTFDQIEAVYLAGGFGHHIDIQNAAAIGLLPMELSGKVIPVGNTSGTAAMLSLKSTLFGQSLNKLRQRMHSFDLSEDPDFTEVFALNMNFPLS